MRTTLKCHLPVEAGNEGARNGRIDEVLGDLARTVQPEAMYFGVEDGRRTIYAFFDLEDASAIPAIAEPLFRKLNASVHLSPVMTLDELQKGSAQVDARGDLGLGVVHPLPVDLHRDRRVGVTRTRADRREPGRGLFDADRPVWERQVVTTDPLDPGVVRDRAAQLDALFAANVLGMVTGEGDVFTEANDEFLRMIGRTRAELESGIAWPHITPMDQVERDTAAVEAIRRDGSSMVLKDFLRPDGRRVPVLAAVAATGWDPYRWIAVVVDLSHDERLRRLAESEAAIVSTLLEDAPIGFALIDPQLRFVRVNRELAAMNGRTPAEHEGRGVFDVVPGLRESAQPLLERVLATGEPLRDVEIVGTTAADPGVEHTWLESFFPVRMPHGPVVGVAAIARDETEIRTLQRQLNATLARQRDALVQLQEGLLPETLPRVEGLDLAGTYQSATDLISLGGDWYDVVRAPDGRLVVSVGDAVGHGVAAVGVMARASGAVRAYVCEGHRPAQILTCLNALLSTEDSAGLATAVIVSIDPTTGDVEYAGAGHPYPLLRTASGAVSALDASQGPLLGATPTPRFRAGTTTMPPGSALLLYTDGLIERREESISEGQERLAAALSGAPVSAGSDELVRTALQACLSGRDRADDVCLLAVTRPAPS